ncbi:MAG TPA: DegT/DnrJ/EryC1/StrS aminotransferase family protein [Steroidobacteraceae bacterium]|nr:DegT/DnrJ/EryC1/StrS aminotransferase family protein [Steroidobacteraceae bacterium]
MQDFLPFTRPTIDDETIAEVVAVLRSGWITSGPKVQELERALGAFLGGNREVRVMTSATGGMEMALKAAGVGAGDEVIVPAMSFAASANVVVRVGARPVFVDVELRSRNATPEAFAAALTPRTRALMPVHFSGLAVDMDPVNALARAHGLRVIEDAAHAIGTRYRGRLIGAFGDIVSFSFHANKNMTTVEGGALTFADPELALPLDRERFHGITKDAAGNVDVYGAGGKYNLTDVAAAVGIGQLRRLPGFNARRRELARRYFERLESRLDPDMLPPAGDEGHSWHMFTVLVPFARLGLTRDEFIARMKARGIGLGIHYPSIPALTYYRRLGWDPAAFPNAARIGAETVTLPLFPAMLDSDVDRVCDALLELMKR